MAEENCSSMAKRCRQDSLRASWLETNSSNGIGRFFVHNPPGERKSGMPHSVEMPAPVNGTILPAPWTRSCRRAKAVSRSGAIMLDWLTLHNYQAPSYIFGDYWTSGGFPYAVSAHNAARAQSRCGA